MSDNAISKVLTSEFGIDLKIGNEDVVSVVVAKEEKDLRRQLKIVNTDINDLKDNLRKLQKDLAKSVKTQVSGLTKTVVSDASASLKSIGFDVLVKISEGTASEDPDGHLIISYDVSVSDNVESWRSATISRTKRIGAAGAVQLTWNKIEEQDAELDTKTRMWADLRGHLSDLPSLERAARAAMATEVLSQTEAGREFLVKLDAVQPIRMLEAD